MVVQLSGLGIMNLLDSKQGNVLYCIRTGLLWQIKEQHHRDAALEQIVVVIQVGIMWNFSIEQLPPHIFDPNLVCLQVWNAGQPTKNNE